MGRRPVDGEDKVSERKVFDHTSDRSLALLDTELTQYGISGLNGRPSAPDHHPLVLPKVAVSPADRSLAVSASRPGNALYLASITVIATAIAGIFFGAGYSLLAPSARGLVSSSNQPLAAPRLHVTEREAERGPLSATSSSVAAALPAVSLTPAVPVAGHAAAPADEAAQKASETARTQEDRQVTEASARLGPSAAPAHEAPAASVKAPITASAPDLPVPKPGLSAAEIAHLLKHGDDFLSIGDLASARLFYERAATAGDGRAALRLGATFDPDFLERAGLRNVKGDPAVAQSWYSRALDFGAPEARRQLNFLNSKQ
jgi:hypothetical protein